MRVVDVLQAFPELLLALIIITFFGAGWLNATVAIGVAGIPRYARMVRVQTALVRRAAYVEAARTLGLHDAAIVWRHVLPNAIEPILPLAMIGVGATIAAGAAISFIGLGTPPPAAEWGAMLAMGRNFMGTAWWLVALPGLAISLSVLALSAVGRAWLQRHGATR
jgi:peptide/nickel transport system permease protein